MKKSVSQKSVEEILRTYPVTSNNKGWHIKVEETSNNAFYIEATDYYGRIISKQGNDSIKLQEEIEKLIKEIKISR